MSEAPGDPPRGRSCRVDSAQAFSIGSRALPMLMAPISTYLVGTRLAPELQGYHYTFASLLALQIAVELGLSIILVNIVSHEWAHLRLDATGAVAGPPEALERLRSVARFAWRWYAAISGLAFLLLAGAGEAFFSRSAWPPTVWRGPWLALCAVGSMQLLLVPGQAILEGCNQLRTLYVVRSVNATVSALALWAGLVGGAHLWAAPLSIACGVLASGTLLLRLPASLWSSMRTGAAGPPSTLSWRRDILPLQWRIGLQGIVAFFAGQLFNPVVFHYHGAVAAGQMGMTMSLFQAVGRVGYSMVEPVVPTFGMLIARREFGELDRRYTRALWSSSLALFAGVGAVLGLIGLLHALDTPFRQRLLDLPAATALALATLLLHVSQCRSAFLRSHKRDPQVFLAVSSSVFIGLAVWLLGRRFGGLGAATGYALVQLLYVTPLQTMIFRRSRLEFRTPAP